MRIKNHTIRRITRFLWWPVIIDYEKRWWEKATWQERYYICGQSFGYWFREKWIDE